MRRKYSNNRTRYFPGDKKPGKYISKDKMSYQIKLSKHNGQMRWLVIEKPTGSILCATAFEDEAKKVADFQNKYKQWVPQGGVVKHLTLGKI